MSSCKTTWSLTVLDSPLTVVELSLILAGNSSTGFDTILTIVEASLVILTVVDLLADVAVGASTVPTKSLGILDVSSLITVKVVLAGGPLSITGEAAKPISSINTVFNGFCVPWVTTGEGDR